MQAGEKLKFGKYDWRVLDVQNDKVLVITEEIIEQRPYHKAYKDITWADCELREYLNGEFYDRFNEADRSKIVPVANKNPDNPWYGTTGGEDTEDKIFILSLEEAVCKYFGDSSMLLYNRGKNRYWSAKDENNSKRVARFAGGRTWWWLRSSGRNNRVAAYVHGTDIAPGCVGVNGNNITNSGGGIRPAMWIMLG